MVRNRKVPIVTPKTRRWLEDNGSQFAEHYYSEQISEDLPIPVDHFYEYVLPTVGDIETFPSDELEFGVEGEARPAIDGNQSALVLSETVYIGMVDGNPRHRFTGAHECSHGIHHLPQIEHKLIESNIPKLYRRAEIPRYRDPEWQATVWASGFLMPTRAVVALVNEVGSDPTALMKRFNISHSAAETRLYYLRREGLIR